MPWNVVDLLACLQGSFGRHQSYNIWKATPHYLMWCIWRERNVRSFEEWEWDNFRIKSQIFEDLAQVDGSFREVFFFKFFFFFFYNKSFSNLFVYIIHCNFRSLVPPSANILLVYLLIHLNKYYSLRPNLFVLYSIFGMSQNIVLFLKLKSINLLMFLLCPYFISKTIFDKFI